MATYRKLSVGILVAASVLLAISGCGDVENAGGKTLTGLTISPTSASMKIGSVESFASIAQYSDSSALQVSASWTVTGNIGSVVLIGLNAQFIASQEGSGSLTAAYLGQSASASITVTELNPLTTIEVTPAESSVRVTGVEEFSASGINLSGETVAISPTWTVTGEATGAFTFEGTVATFEASTEGIAYINCISKEVTGTSILTVEGFITTITAEGDTYVDSSSPEASYGTSIVLNAGRIATPSEKIYQSYIKFALPAGAVSIEVATLKVYATSVSGGTMNIGNLGGIWDGTKTWSSKPTIESYEYGPSFSSGSNSISITALANKWLAANWGLAIYTDDTTTNSITIVSTKDSTSANRPQLYLEYKTH